MKFSCEKALLLGAVSTASRAVAVKSSIPALEGILIEAGEQLRLTGYNLETGIRAAVPAEIREKGSLVLSARLFGEIIRKMPDDVVVFTSENYMVNIKCGLSEFNILGTDPEEFPELPSVEEQNGLTIGQPVLRSMIAQTLFAVSDNESRPVHTGSLFEVDESGLTVVSVDGYRLAIREEKAADAVEAMNFVVPGKSLGEVLKLLSDDEESKVSLQVGRRHILFNIGRYTLISRLLEGEFLDYRAAIPASASMEVICKTRDFIESVERVSLLITDRLKSPVGLLSGGQRQALTLLMATLVTPKLLLLDEHTAALDPATAEKVLELTRSIVAENNITCMMITHNIRSALELGNRTIMMDAGRIVLDLAGEERAGMTVDALLEKFRTSAGKELDNDRILLSDRE